MDVRRSLVLSQAVMMFSAAAVAAGGVEFKGDGLSIEAGTAGPLLMQWPVLRGEDGRDVSAMTEAKVAGDGVRVSYKNGGVIEIRKAADGSLAFSVKSMPGEVKSLWITTLVPFNVAGDGGTYRLDGGAAVAFPKEKPKVPQLTNQNGQAVAISTASGGAVTVKFPEWTFLQLTDNREWNWKIFALHASIPVIGDKEFPVGVSTSAKAVAARVDRFGQPKGSSYPGKVASEAELKADVEADAVYYASFKPKAVDRFGGVPGSGAALGLKKTGWFHMEKHGESWMLVDPEGNLFFLKGVCSNMPGDDFTYVAGREGTYEWLPSSGEFGSVFREGDKSVVSFHLANQIRKFGVVQGREAYAGRMLDRLKAWGFNTVGPFCEIAQAVNEKGFSYTVSFGFWNVPMIPGVRETWDPFDERVVGMVKDVVLNEVRRRKDDPHLIGYFLNNEPIYEDVPRVIPRLDGKSAAKRKLVEMLRQKYGGDIGKFNAAWEENAASFDALVDKGLAATTAGANGDVSEFCEVFFDTYYRLMSETIRSADTNHLLLGNRLQAGTINNERLMKIAAKYMDVISFNYYSYGIDPAFLGRIYGWTGKPMILSEYFFSSPSDSGLPGGIKDVSSQAERGLAFRNYVEQSAALGYVLGTQWFMLVDQSYTGRWFEKYNGENANAGMISVADRPYKEMVSQMAATNAIVEEVALGRRKPFVWDDPRVTIGRLSRGAGNKTVNIPRAAGAVKLDGTTAGFPGTPAEQLPSSRLVLGGDAGGLEAAFKVCWDEKNLYLSMQVTDSTPQMNSHAPEQYWSGDAVELFFGPAEVEKEGALLSTDRQVFLSGGKVGGGAVAKYVAKAAIVCRTFPAPDGKGYTLQAAVPFAALGFQPKAGEAIRFDIGLDDSADGQRRLRQLMWNGGERNSGDRSGWGRAVFGQ